MNEERSPRGNTVLLTVIAVATLLVAVIGATFAYFSVTVSNEGDPVSVLVKTAQLSVTYAKGQNINATELVPGGTIDPLTFTISNSSDVDVTVDITWTYTSTFPAANDITFALTGDTATEDATLSGQTSTTTGTLPGFAGGGDTGTETGTDVKLATVTIPKATTPGTTPTTYGYKLTLVFANATSEQNAQQNKEFNAIVKVGTATTTQP